MEEVVFDYVPKSYQNVYHIIFLLFE